MNRHRDILTTVVAQIVQADPYCGIVLQGSVADGCERPDSDLDLFVVCSTDTPKYNTFIQEENRGRMQAKGPVDGIQVDVGWEEVEKLASSVAQDGAAGWYMFSRGTVTNDPAGHAGRCQRLMRDWLRAHPRIAAAWSHQHQEVRKRKSDPNHPLEYPTFGDFYKHLQELDREEK